MRSRCCSCSCGPPGRPGARGETPDPGRAPPWRSPATPWPWRVFIPAGADASPGPTQSGRRPRAAGRHRHARHRRGARVLTVTADRRQRSADPTRRRGPAVDRRRRRRRLAVEGRPPTPASPPPRSTSASSRDMTGGRLPVGLGNARTPGPFDAQWSASTVYTVLAHGDDVVAAEGAAPGWRRSAAADCTAPKTVSVGGLATDWATPARRPGDRRRASPSPPTTEPSARCGRYGCQTVLGAAAACPVVLAAVRAAAEISRRTKGNNDMDGEHGQAPAEIGVA